MCRKLTWLVSIFLLLSLGHYASAATNPYPADGATDVPIDVVLSWSPGHGALMYDVYFGTSSPPPWIGKLVETSYDPGTLEPGTTYFWRVNDFTAMGTNPGPVWSFTTMSGSEKATNPYPADGAEDVHLNITLIWDPASVATSQDVYFGTSSLPPFVGNQTASDYNPGTLEPGVDYYWRIDTVRQIGEFFITYTGDVWSFTTISGPERATNPYPTDGAENVPLNIILSWDPGSGATSHDVYFGTSSPPPFVCRYKADDYPPAGLEPGTTYFWKINEVVPVIEGPPIIIEGEVWDFTTVKVCESGTTLFSDDFESYTLGILPSADWEIVWAGTGENYVTDVYSFSPTKSLQLWGRPNWSSVAQRKFSTNAPLIGYECAIRIDSIGTGGPGREESVGFFNREAYIWGRGYAAVLFNHDDGEIKAEDDTVLGDWEPGIWYQIKVVLDRRVNTYDVWIDGQLRAEGLSTTHSDTEIIDALALMSDHAGVKVYYDDVRVFSQVSDCGSAVQWNIDFQGDKNHNNTYGQTDPVDYTEPGVYWNVFEVAALSAPWPGPTNYTTNPSMDLADIEGRFGHGKLSTVKFSIIGDAYGWAGDAGDDALTGDYLIILNNFGVTNDPTNWQITGLAPNTAYYLTYSHHDNVVDRGINFVANGIKTTVSVPGSRVASALITTDFLGRIRGTADSNGYNEGNWSALTITAVATTAGNVEFRQINWYDSYGVLVQENSLWGRMSFSYYPTDTTSYLNVTLANSLAGAGAWVVQNLPLFAVDNGDYSKRGEAVDINLAELGMLQGQDWSTVYWKLSVDRSIRTEALTEPNIFSTVEDLDRFAWDSVDEAPDPGPFTNPGTPEGVKLDKAPVKESKSRDVRSVQEDDVKCCAGSFARSIDWLNREYNLGVGRTAQQIYDDLIAVGVSKLNDDGSTARDDWIALKNTYTKQKTGNKIVTKVWDPGGMIDPVTGVTEVNGDFVTWLKNELKHGEDIELAYYYPGGAHIVTVLEVYTKDSDTYVKYRDDEEQGDNDNGDKKVKHKKIYKKDGKYHFGADSNTIYFAVSESPDKNQNGIGDGFETEIPSKSG